MKTEKEILCNRIKEVIKERGYTQKFVADQVKKTEKQLSDILTKNTSIDVFDVRDISKVLKYNFFTLPMFSGQEKIDTYKPNRRKARISVTIDVEDEVAEKEILSQILDKTTVKRLIG
ncbi:MAG: helix-turn-helix transcriptional regulator [Bacteroidota bacterium]|nr:helix-turn-helix transcriptional regulator [Bacteroidota bacterium]